MRIQVLSDLHVEFHRDLGEQLITKTLKPDSVDVLILAGDLGQGPGLRFALPLLSKAYKESLILFVPGNHEYYGSGFDEVAEELDIYEEQLKNFVVLNNKALEIGEFLFVGSTLWFPETTDYQKYSRLLNDFHLIREFVPRVFEEHMESIRFLDWHVGRNSIVITHHVPTNQSTAPEYKNDPLNRFFVHNLEKLIQERQPKLWVHGHTHNSYNYTLDNTHIVCNPLGYVGREVNPEFLPNMMIDT